MFLHPAVCILSCLFTKSVQFQVLHRAQQQAELWLWLQQQHLQVVRGHSNDLMPPWVWTTLTLHHPAFPPGFIWHLTSVLCVCQCQQFPAVSSSNGKIQFGFIFSFSLCFSVGLNCLLPSPSTTLFLCCCCFLPYILPTWQSYIAVIFPPPNSSIFFRKYDGYCGQLRYTQISFFFYCHL